MRELGVSLVGGSVVIHALPEVDRAALRDREPIGPGEQQQPVTNPPAQLPAGAASLLAAGQWLLADGA